MNQQIDNALGGYEESEIKKVIHDALSKGYGFMKNGKSVSPNEVFKEPAPDIKYYKFESGKYWRINWAAAGGESEGDIVSKPIGAKPAPDTLLEQIKELRPIQGELTADERMNGTMYYYITRHHNYQSFEFAKTPSREFAQWIALIPQMADLCISQAVRIEELMQTIESQKKTNLTILKRLEKKS
jgi:hypothetical protein